MTWWWSGPRCSYYLKRGTRWHENRNRLSMHHIDQTEEDSSTFYDWMKKELWSSALSVLHLNKQGFLFLHMKDLMVLCTLLCCRPLSHRHIDNRSVRHSQRPLKKIFPSVCTVLCRQAELKITPVVSTSAVQILFDWHWGCAWEWAALTKSASSPYLITTHQTHLSLV